MSIDTTEQVFYHANAMQNILLETSVRASQNKAFEALTTADGVAHWWTTDVKLEAKLDSIAEFGFGNRAVVMQMKVVELQAPASVQWLCLDQPADWTGTTIAWRLAPDNQHTKITFSQTNWKPAVDSAPYAARWQYFMDSLKSYLETGHGTPE